MEGELAVGAPEHWGALTEARLPGAAVAVVHTGPTVARGDPLDMAADLALVVLGGHVGLDDDLVQGLVAEGLADVLMIAILGKSSMLLK